MPLCDELYEALQKWSGGEVLVASEGEGISVTDDGVHATVLHPGEVYRANCRFCNDTRHRLYVGYRWYDYRFMAHCFNETECLSNPDIRRMFRDEILFKLNHTSPYVVPADAPPEEDRLSNAPPPGHVVSLAAAPPGHPAVRYVVERGFDPVYLTRQFGVGVCLSSDTSPAMVGRVYVPFYDGVRIAGWQGRHPADPPVDPATGKRSWKQFGVTKYYNRTGFRKSRYLYGPPPSVDPNLPFVVLVEGVTDVWRVGPAARAYCGIELSAFQREIVLRRWGRGVVVCMGDGSAQEKNDHQASLLRQEMATLGGTVVRVDLLPDKDPGGLSWAENWDLIEQATASAGRPVRRPGY